MPTKAAIHWRAQLWREVKRKSIHLLGLSVPTSIFLLGREITIGLIGLALVISIFLEWGRLQGKITLPSVRDHERSRVAGYIYYIVGAFLTVLLFSPMIAVTAMLMLSIGDAASGIMGSIVCGSNVRSGLVEKGTWRPKPQEVVVGTFIICLLVGYAASGITKLVFPVYLIGAVSATIADAIPFSFRQRVVDDNFTIPILSGSMMTLATL